VSAPHSILQKKIDAMFEADRSSVNRVDVLRLFDELKTLLNLGQVRAAENIGGSWQTNPWVKKGILLGFRFGVLRDVSLDDQFRFFDKSTLPLKKITLTSEVRLVPGGSAIRDGAYVAKGVVCMPPMYINIGAYVDEETMIDSHALVGSCAQIGKRVHLSAGAQIGGVLEPVGSLPVIIEDDVLIGGNCGVYEGAIVKRSAVLAAGVILAGGTAVYDVEKEQIYRKTENQPLTIPEGAVVVPGTRPLEKPWAKGQQLSVATPVIIKYRDERTNRSTMIEEILR
jgi:2,3,4,5-tetrahydropyridine-2-carboxylate N-succinyltransferase